MHIDALFAGKPQPFGPRQMPSSIIKRSHRSLQIELDGAIEDEQGNKKLHGGPEMALHQYSQQAYERLRDAFPRIANKLVFGSIGENISMSHMNDDNVHIGDIYQIGDVVLQVNSPRQPCSKINHRYDMANMDIFVAEHGITGWYYRVLETGTLNEGAKCSLIHRLQHTVSIKEMMHLVRNKEHPDREQASQIQGLAKEWVRKLLR